MPYSPTAPSQRKITSFRHTWATFKTSIRSSPSYRLKFVLKLIFVFFFSAFVFMQCIKAAVSYANPSWTLAFPNSWDIHEWRLLFPPFTICPGFERVQPEALQQERFGAVGHTALELLLSEHRRALPTLRGEDIVSDGRYIPGTIDSVQCDFVTVAYTDKGEKTLKKEPISIKSSKHVIDVSDAALEFQCYDINTDLEKAPVLRYSQIANFVSCSLNSSTYIKFSPYSHGSRPFGNWTQWTNLADDTATNVALQKVEVKFVSGAVTLPYYEVTSIQEELSWQSVSESTKLTMFTVSFPQITTKRYQQYYQEDLVQMIGAIGGIGFVFTLLYRALMWLFVDVFGVDRTSSTNDDSNLYDDDDDDSIQENIAISPRSYKKTDYEGLKDEGVRVTESTSNIASPLPAATSENDLTVVHDEAGYGAIE